MKNIITTIASIVLIISAVPFLSAQTPYLINYQAVARNTTTGQELAHQPIFVSVKILIDGPNGDIVYQENHDGLTTNYLGLFNLFIGGGQPVSGSFDAIQWGSSAYWLAVDLDVGQGLQSMGSMQLVAVPYALHAETVSQVDDADADPTNELVQAIEFNPETNVFSLIQEGGILTQDLSALIDDADADPTNELVQAIDFNSETNIFSLTQEGETLTQDLSGLLEGVDTDPTNELVQAIAFDEETNIFSLVQEGGTLTQDLSALIKDDDSDPSNELVHAIAFDSETNIFSLVQEGGTLTQDLGDLVNDADSDPTNELVQSIGFDEETSIFSLVQEGGTLSQDLSALINDADSDPLNEAITNIQLIGTDLVVTEVSDWSVSLSQLVNDADADPTNELINSLELINDTLLRIKEGPTAELNLNLAPLKRDENWRKLGDNESITNYGSKVGIATTSPSSTLEISGSIGYKTVLLDNTSGAVSYSVSDTDHIIVCKVAPANINSFTIIMPDPATCPGRYITIRKTGNLPISAPVIVDFGSAMFEFSAGGFSMNDFQRETATFISLGSDGWTKLY